MTLAELLNLIAPAHQRIRIKSGTITYFDSITVENLKKMRAITQKLYILSFYVTFEYVNNGNEIYTYLVIEVD